MKTGQKQIKRIMLWLMLAGLFIFTIGQYVPVYFSYPDFRLYFYPIMLASTIIAVAAVSYDSMYLPHKDNKLYSTIISLLTTVIVFLVLAFITVGKLMTLLTDTGPIYLMKSNPNVEITSCYINEGAFGGGTEPDDYQIVVKSPLTSFFYIVTSVDTTKIDKTKWIRQNIFSSR